MTPVKEKKEWLRVRLRVMAAGAGRESGLHRARGWDGVRLQCVGLLLGPVLIVVGAMLALSASARAADCSLADFAYNGACGPEFESPAWGDTAGWTDPSKYSTIQLADLTASGRQELIARNDQGLEIWTFDTTVGQWRPAIGADGLPEVLRDFHSPLPTEDVRETSWRTAAAFSTIQTADLDGDGAQEIVADYEPIGTRVWRYTPPAGTRSIDGGTWSLVGTASNILPTAPSPSQYLSLHAIAGFLPPAVLVDQSSYWTWDLDTDSFQPTGRTTLAPDSSEPQYYLNNMSGLMPELYTSTNPVLVSANVYRTPDGVAVQWFDGPNWEQLGPPPTSGFQCQATNSCSPFTDTDSPTCSTAASNCFGSNPAYYETMRVASNLLGPDDTNGYVLGRLADGLHVFALKPYTSPSGPYLGWDSSYPVLTDVKDPSNGFPPPGEWSSIRTGDITGDGQTEVLALMDGQLRAWQLQSTGSEQLAWSELPANPALNLGSMWEDNASYYSTIQVGQVAGLGSPDAVIARGPFGIRTWFYNLRGSGGWTSWLPQDLSSYPQFAGGQAAAWTELNTLAQDANLIGPSSTVRDVWTGTTAPTDENLANLQNGVLVFAGCTGQTSANPPTYSSCAVPARSSGFTAGDWTAVVNETLAEIYYAVQTTDFFTTLANLNNDIFLAKEAELPAISSSVAALGQAAGNNIIQVSPQDLWSNGLGIASALAGILDPALGAALGIASSIAGIIPSATPDLNQPPFNSTLNGLQNDLANAVTQAAAAVDAQSYEVRQNYGMLRLVGQLTGPSGPWNEINTAGLQGSMNQGFALWAYKQLLPTMLERDVVTDCASGNSEDVNCSWTGFAGGIGSQPNFTYLNSPHTENMSALNSWPCWSNWNSYCSYTHAPTAEVNGVPGSDIATKVWGPLSDTCNFNGDPHTEWTFDCNLGIDPMLSTDAVGGPANGWNFTTCTGANPMLLFSDDFNPPFPTGSCSSSTSASATTGPHGSVELTAAAGLPASFQIRGATLIANRLLYEPRGRGNLLTGSGGGSLGTVQLTATGGNGRGGAGDTVLGSPPGEPPITLTHRRTLHGQAQLSLRLSRIGFAVPDACRQLPASISLTTQPFTLETSLQLSDGHVTETVSLPAQWTCVRNRGGAVTGLRTVEPPSPAQHRALAVSIAGPRTVTPGSIATYTVSVRNTRRGPRNTDISSLSNILVRVSLGQGASPKPTLIRGPDPVVRRLPELRPGETKLLRISMLVPDGLQQASIDRVCAAAGAIADSTRPAGAQACSNVATLR